MTVQEKLRSFDKVIFLRKKGYSTRKIAKQVGISNSQVWEWINGKGWGNLNLPNLKPSKELSYLLGAVFGDGWVGKSGRQYQIRLSAVDFSFVTEFRNCIKIILNKEYPIKRIFISKKNPKWSDQYLCIAYSKALFEFLKGKEISNFSKIIEKYPQDFVRGFADAEGCIMFKEGKRLRVTEPIIEITNTNKQLLIYVQKLLERLGIHSKIYGPRIHIGRKLEVLKFYKKVNFKNKAKKEKLKFFVDNYSKQQ